MPTIMTDEPPRAQSHLFTVRVWREELGGSCAEWRGKVQHPLSGEARYFREWTELIAFMREQVGDAEPGIGIRSNSSDGSLAR